MTNKLTLPFPPSINHYWKHRAIGKRASVYLSSEALAYREAVKNSITATKPLDTRLSVSVRLHAPNRRKYDIDNRVKFLLDALTHSGAWLDDELIDQLQIERGAVMAGGLCVVEIHELELL
jgi:crossover junction endodeoxyribonuclease RusA